MPRRIASPTLVGRSPELAVIRRAIDRTLAGSPSRLLLAGEAGVGKSRLAGEAAAIATAHGMLVLAGGCASIGDGGVPFGPIVEALRSLVRELPADELQAIAGRDRADLARLIPALSDASAAEAPAPAEPAPPRLLDALLGLIGRLSAHRPVLLVLEDLHWADPASREAIGFLVHNLRAERAMVLMTFRSDELHRRHPLLPWLAELDRSGQVERLDLERLGPDETRALVAAILGRTPRADELEPIVRRSDGNPFFVEELIGAVGEGGTGRLPPTLREILIAQIAELPDAAQSVIGVAAVAGRPVDHDLLAEVAAMDEPRLLDGLRTAVNGHVLVAGVDGDAGDYTFRHALLQEAAYDDLLPGERLRLHRAFASALAARGPGSGAAAAAAHWAELAYHWSASRDDRRAFEASVRAGLEAARTFAFADAWRQDERALELWSRVDSPTELAGCDEVELLDRAAQAAWLGGDSRRAVALRREAIATLGPDGDPFRLGILLERLGRSSWQNAETEAAVAAYERALKVLPVEPPSAERARVLSGYGQLLMLLDRQVESITYCRAAIEMARRVGARAAEGHALNTLGTDLAMTGHGDEGIRSLREAIAIAREVANADDIGRGYVNLTDAYLSAGRIGEAMDAAHEGMAATDEVGILRTYGLFVRENAITLAFELGDWAEAKRLAAESAVTEQVGVQHQRYALANWVRLLVASGDPIAESRLGALWELLDGFPIEAQFNTPYRIAAAEHALWQGDPARAFRTAEEGLREIEGRGWHWLYPRLYRVAIWAAADLAEIARARRDTSADAAATDAGARVEAAFLPLVAAARERQHGQDAAWTEAEARTVEAERLRLLGTLDAPAWEDAADRWGALGNPYSEAWCRWRLAAALLEAGDRPGATAALGRAHRLAEALGARPLREGLEALAARARLEIGAVAGPVSASNGGAVMGNDQFGLTRRELDVVALLVLGRTNRQIAETLFISENTAGVHVSNILGKLGAASRTEAAAIAARLGLGAEPARG